MFFARSLRLRIVSSIDLLFALRHLSSLLTDRASRPIVVSADGFRCAAQSHALAYALVSCFSSCLLLPPPAAPCGFPLILDVLRSGVDSRELEIVPVALTFAPSPHIVLTCLVRKSLPTATDNQKDKYYQLRHVLSNLSCALIFLLFFVPTIDRLRVVSGASPGFRLAVNIQQNNYST